MSPAGERTRLSRRLAFLLRHRPDRGGLRLDRGGWADVDAVRRALAAWAGRPVSAEELRRLVREDPKGRYELDEANRRVRARYGHSVEVDLGLAPEEPPPLLFHGTTARSLPSIRREGLRPGRRRFVHLSETEEEAARVGARRGAPVVLGVRARALAAAGEPFFRTAAGIWLTRRVPPAFLRIPGDDTDEGRAEDRVES